MSCFFYRNNCCNNCCNPYQNCYQNYQRPCNPCCRGPQGLQGPRGFTGAPGAPGLNGTLYAGVTGSPSVATDAIVPITAINSSPASPFTVAGGTITVPAGTYLVTFGMDANTGGAAIVEATLYVNGTASTTEYVTAYTSTTEPALSSKTVLLTFPTAGTLALYNTSEATATYDTGYITITQLSA